MSQSASFETALLHNTISVVSLLSFYQMLTLTPRVEFPVLLQLGLGLPLKTRVNFEAVGYRTRLGLGFLLGLGLGLSVWVQGYESRLA